MFNVFIKQQAAKQNVNFDMRAVAFDADNIKCEALIE